MLDNQTKIDELVWAKHVITCPKCKMQFHASEVFYPDDFVGKPATVVKDALNKIIYLDYEEDAEPVLAQTYECDGCGNTFVVEASLSFKVRETEPELDFKQQYTSII